MHKDLGKRYLENFFAALLKHFLGSIYQSSAAYGNWHEMAGNDVDTLGSQRFRGHHFQILSTVWTLSKLWSIAIVGDL